MRRRPTVCVLPRSTRRYERAQSGATIETYFVGAAPTSDGGVRYFGSNQGGTVYHSTTAVAVTQNGAPAGADPLQ
tara:strand:+ start:983 stop:1207 length:225 start_codon:yes stop_codon:yes gene_type:complete